MVQTQSPTSNRSSSLRGKRAESRFRSMRFSGLSPTLLPDLGTTPASRLTRVGGGSLQLRCTIDSMETNTILALAFTVISNFAASVHVAPEAVPRGTNDVEAFTIGRPCFPLDLYLRDRRGDQFWIRHGVVCLYQTPGSYFTLQDPRLIGTFVGVAKLSSNEVFQLAADATRHLIRTGDPLAHVKPTVRVCQ